MATDEKRRLVIQLSAFDWSIEKIAAALSITPPTLRKNYFRELRSRAEAKVRVEAKLLNALMTEVDKGNVTAVDKYFKRLDRHELARPSAPRREEKAPKLGKKEQAVIDAKAGHSESSWGGLLN